MPCNLAVSITKASIDNDYLRELLNPEGVELTLRALLNATINPLGCPLQEDASSIATRAVETVFAIQREGTGIRCRIGGYYGIDLLVTAGVVTVNTTFPAQQPQAEAWLILLQTALNRVARMTLAAQLAAALPSATTTTTEVTIAEDGTRQLATRLTLTL